MSFRRTSLQFKLAILWILLVASSIATGILLYKFYDQSAAVQLRQAEFAVDRGCKSIVEHYGFFVAGWNGSGAGDADGRLPQQLVGVVNSALFALAGVEGGIWSRSGQSLAYAFPTYEGSGPKTDLPPAELPVIAQVNADALREMRPRVLERAGSSQTLVLQACLLPGPVPELTAWAMARAFTGRGPAYMQLLIGLGVLAVTVLGSALFLGLFLVGYTRRVAGLERALAASNGTGTLPVIAPIGDRELDRLILALNAAGGRLTETHSRLVAAERMAALGRLAAGIAHEIRNPLAAMRLKAENARASGDAGRAQAALATILEQVSRLDRLLGDLLHLTHPRPARRVPSDVNQVVTETVLLHAELAQQEGVEVATRSEIDVEARPLIDPEQIGRAVSNLLLNALQATAGRGRGRVEISVVRAGDRLRISVADDGPGIPDAIRPTLFEPFVTGRHSGSGLGLALARDIARGHGGEARLRPSASGSHFELDLPWRES